MIVDQATLNARASQVGYSNTEITRLTPLVRAIIWATIAFETAAQADITNGTAIAAAATEVATADGRIADAWEAAEVV